MKKITFLCVLWYCTPFYGQVGIATTAPTATLDVNGTTRLRATTTTAQETAAKDSILVTNDIGNVMRVSSKSVIESHLKTFIKGSFVTSTDVLLTLSGGTKLIPFNYEEFDTNNEYNTTTSTFTATQSGIYEIAVHIKSASGISVTPDFGVAILKNGTVVSKDSYANVGVTVVATTVNVTPPVRSASTIMSLIAGDTINFNIISSLASLGILGTREDCYFTIHQVR